MNRLSLLFILGTITSKTHNQSLTSYALNNLRNSICCGIFFTFRLEGSSGNRVGFTSELRLLVDALQMSFEAQFIEDFVSGSHFFRCI